jgi:hypothetical protein
VFGEAALPGVSAAARAQAIGAAASVAARRNTDLFSMTLILSDWSWRCTDNPAQRDQIPWVAFVTSNGGFTSMAKTRLMGCQNLPGGDQSHLKVCQDSDFAARGCNVATYQPMQMRQSGCFKVCDQFTKFRVHQDSPGRGCAFTQATQPVEAGHDSRPGCDVKRLGVRRKGVG